MSQNEERAEQSYPPKQPEIVVPTPEVRLGGITGKGFMPGHGKINGAGRPRGLASMIRRQTKDGTVLVRRFYQLFMGEKIKKTVVTITGEIKEIEVRPSVPDMIEAGKWLADRGWGKALEIVQIEGETRRPVLIVLPGPRRDPLEDDPEPVDEPKRKVPALPPHLPEIGFELSLNDLDDPKP